jgi:hypothetical protein
VTTTGRGQELREAKQQYVVVATPQKLNTHTGSLRLPIITCEAAHKILILWDLWIS